MTNWIDPLDLVDRGVGSELLTLPKWLLPDAAGVAVVWKR